MCGKKIGTLRDLVKHYTDYHYDVADDLTAYAAARVVFS